MKSAVLKVLMLSLVVAALAGCSNNPNPTNAPEPVLAKDQATIAAESAANASRQAPKPAGAVGTPIPGSLRVQ